MEFKKLGSERQADLKGLFHATFGSSEGEEAGLLIKELVTTLAKEIDDRDVLCFGALQDHVLIGGVFFTRLWFSNDSLVYMLSPMAVSTAHQRTGVGQALIRFALEKLAARGANITVTYGDPAYYQKVGFDSLSESVLQAPMTLSMPEGWLGQSLTGEPIQAQPARPACIEAFRNAVHW